EALADEGRVHLLGQAVNLEDGHVLVDALHRVTNLRDEPRGAAGDTDVQHHLSTARPGLEKRLIQHRGCRAAKIRVAGVLDHADDLELVAAGYGDARADRLPSLERLPD